MNNLTHHIKSITKTQRAAIKKQAPCVIWLTGLSGSGKSTVANALDARLHAMGAHTYLLDGDNVRLGLNKDLGFSDADRKENIRRIGEVAALFVDAGLIVIVAFISPLREDRDQARALVNPEEFVEVYLSTPIEVCEERDPKGLYKKARAGEIKSFTGIDSPYEVPLHPEIVINTAECGLEEAVERIVVMING